MRATQPDSQGHFGKYGGMYVPETLMEPLNELTRVFKQASKDASFKKELRHCLETYVGRPCLLYTSPSPRDISGSRMPSSA